MKRRTFLQMASIAATGLGLPHWSRSESASGHPNVLFIAIDDMNDWIDTLDRDNPIHTPHISRLANRGVLFTRAYCSSPACNPSRASLLTGYRPSTTGIYGNKSDWRGALPNAQTLPQYFMNHGYKAYGAGKIFHHHLDGAFHDKESFDDFQLMPWLPDSPMPKEKLNGLEWYGSPNTDWGIWPTSEDQKHVDIRTVDYVIEQLNQSHESPFFLVAGIFRPHMPFFAPEEYFEKYPLEETRMPKMFEEDLEDIPSGGQKLLNAKKWFFQGMMKAEKQDPGTWKESVRAYQACASFADAQVGRLLDALDKSPHADNTVIVLWSDHGYHLGEKEHWEKFALWEKTTHVPLIFAGAGIPHAGVKCDQPVDLVHLYPTLTDLCGLPRNNTLDGVSLVPLLKDPDQKWERPAISTYQRGNHAIRTKRWRLITYIDGSVELYDHENDPHEWYNLADDPQYANVIARLKRWVPLQDAPQVPDMK